MDLRQLRYFCAIAARRSFRQASDDVRIAQPALSQQIRHLEAELGVRLFDRAVRPVELTAAGEVLLPRARQLLADADRAAAEVREFGTEFRGKVVIAAMQYLTAVELPDVLVEFHGRYPLVDLQLRVGNSGQVLELLKTGEADLAFCHVDGLELPPEFAVEELRREELVIIVKASDPLAGLRQVSIQELAEVPFVTFRPGASIREALQDAFAEQGLTLHVSFESGDMPTTFALVRRGLGVALVPRSATVAEVDDVTAVPIGPVPLARRVAQVWRKDRHRSRAVDAFAQHAKRSMTRT